MRFAYYELMNSYFTRIFVLSLVIQLLLIACAQEADEKVRRLINIELIGPLSEKEMSQEFSDYDRKEIIASIENDSMYRYEKADPFFVLSVMNGGPVDIELVNLSFSKFIYPVSMDYKGKGRSGTTMNNLRVKSRLTVASLDSVRLLTRLYDVDTILVAFPYRISDGEQKTGVFRQKYKMERDHLVKLEDSMNSY